MGADKYWSVEECCWVEPPGTPSQEAPVALPQQREDEPALEPVEV